jgi:hypothetical protein
MTLVRNIGPCPTLRKMVLKEPYWVWVCCARFPHCMHEAPMAIVPLIIRWGWDESNDTLRRCARCTRCGHKGAYLRHPSWGGMDVGWQSFPAERLVRYRQ